MLLIAIRKMLSNKWMLVCTLIGAIITVAMLSSIPIYTDGIMQRMLTRDMEISQQDSDKYPGGYLIEYDGAFDNGNSDVTYDSLDKKIWGIILKSIDLPVISKCSYASIGPRKVVLDDSKRDITTKISALSDLESHVNIIQGRMFSNQKADGAYEVIASEEAMKVLGLTMGNTYNIADGSIFTQQKPNTFKVKIVGIYGYKDKNDPYWFRDIGQYDDTLLLNFDLLRDTLLEAEQCKISDGKWFFAYDYHKIKLDNLPTILKTLEIHTTWFEKYKLYLSHTVQAEPILKQYAQRSATLKTTLLVLQIPILLILAFYSFMVSGLKIDFESNEIAVLKSRGGSSALVFFVYLIEGLIIGAIALIIGPLIGLYICKIIGASNGFLEFVQRSGLPLSLSPKAYLYSLLAVVFILISMLIPAFIASRTSIVLYKQKKSRGFKASFWKRYFIDFILLAIAFYGLYGYQRQQKLLLISSVKGSPLEIDPLLFLVSVLFIFGCALLVLRIFPYIISFLFRLGRKLWSPVLYATFIGVSRTTGSEQFTMIFIILALSIGIFSASSARTINKNTEDKVRYETGADIVVQGHWTDNRPSGSGSLDPLASTTSQKKDDIVYDEPPFEPYTKLKGVESATKVFKEEDAEVSTSSTIISKVSLMGIIPNEFGTTAWFRSDLLPYHWYQYLNLMTDSPTALLVSKAFKDKLNAKEGDQINISWGDQEGISGIIYAFVDYWPSLNPNKKIDDVPSPYFVVANLSYIHSIGTVEPYQVWIKKKPDASSNEIYKDMENKKIELDSRVDASEMLIKRKNDPVLQGTNGALTLGFIVTMIISVIGFLIYWIMSIKKRVLQFGIFRAMGLTSGTIIGMLGFEQLLITGTSVLAGVGIGGLTSSIFVPLLQLVYGAEEQVPPFKVVALSSDYLRLYIIVGLMLLLCFAVLWRLISRINIGQALKLGED